MGQSRKAPFERLLRLVQNLSESTDGLTLDDMAEVLGQGRRSAERTRDVIALHFDLDELLDGPRKRFRIVDSLRRHFTRPRAEEIAALRAEVESLRPGGGIRFHELQSLLAKVQSSFDDREKMRIEPDLEELLKCQRCQTASKRDPRSASKRDPFGGRCRSIEWCAFRPACGVGRA